MSNPAVTYEREMVPVLFRPWVAPLLELARPMPGEHALDLACGTGVVARMAAPFLVPDGRMVGVDLNPDMLGVAQVQGAVEGLDIEWKQGRLEVLPFNEGEFDLALCQQGLQFVDDRAAALGEARRVLREDGRLAMGVWRGLDHHPFWSRFNDVLVELIGIPALAAPFELGDAAELEALLVAAGFRDIAIQARSMPAVFPDPESFVAMEVDVIAAAVPATQHLDARARADLTEAAQSRLAGAIREQMYDGHVVVPMHSHLVLARM
ncbi:class I SAM-dependent methyltransferase [Lysobacter sp. GCM10012299]|uniref:class I SAM-dependent methyltransferase n=1 Tax=Lysobacter sp. GCM10012299 TaxID=3317333 RepID=UPI0036227A0C